MQHCRRGRIFGRSASIRAALIKGLAISLFTKGSIQTTEAKAKELRPFIEKLVTTAKGGGISGRRKLAEVLPVVVANKVVKDFGQRFVSRRGGYTRIIKIGKRKNDDASRVLMEFVE